MKEEKRTDRKKKILLIEDEETVRLPVRALLEQSNYEVIEASDGAEGEKAVLLGVPDLVILDLNLPKRGGEEILAFLKAHGPTKNIPIIILTGAGSLSKRLYCMLKGASCYIAKPFENVDLLKAVKKYT